MTQYWNHLSVPNEWGPIEDGQPITMPLKWQDRGSPPLRLPDNPKNAGQRSHILAAVSGPPGWATGDEPIWTGKLDYQRIIQYPFLLTYDTGHTREPIAYMAMAADGEILNRDTASISMRFRLLGQRIMAPNENSRQKLCRRLSLSPWIWHHTHWAVHEGDLYRLLWEMPPDLGRTYPSES